MKRPYLIMVNNILAARHLTKSGALKHIEELKAKGMKAVIAYEFKETA